MSDSNTIPPDDDHSEDVTIDSWDGWDYGMNLANQVDENED